MLDICTFSSFFFFFFKYIFEYFQKGIIRTWWYQSAHNSAPEWQTCSFYAHAVNVTLLKWQSMVVSSNQTLVYDLNIMLDISQIYSFNRQLTLSQSCEKGKGWQIVERYYCPCILFLFFCPHWCRKGNCRQVYLWIKVICKVDQWLRLHTIHTHTSTHIHMRGWEPPLPLWLVICVDQLHRSLNGSQSRRHSWELRRCNERSVSISNYAMFHHQHFTAVYDAVTRLSSMFLYLISGKVWIFLSNLERNPTRLQKVEFTVSTEAAKQTPPT